MSALSTLALPARFRRPAAAPATPAQTASRRRQFAGLQQAAYWALALFVIGLPLSLMMFEGASLALKLYLNGLITGLIATGGLLLAMIGRSAASILDDATASTRSAD